MKKLFTLTFALFAISTMLKAQTSGGPDGYGYTWRDNADTLTPGAPTYNWIDIIGLPGATQVKNLADDNTAGPFPIGFNFHYYWYDRSNFRIGSNGYIVFNNGAIASPFAPIPSSAQPQDYLAAMGSDITFVTGGGAGVPNADCWFYTSPTNDSLIISWISVPFWDGVAAGNYTGENTFQMILTSVDSSITFQYQTQLGVYQNLIDFMTIGIENVSGTVGLQHSHDIYPTANKAVKFYYPANSTFVVTDASTVYNNNESSGGLIISNNGNAFIMESEIENSGNQALNPFNITSQILNAGSVVVTTSTVQSDTLQPAQTQLVTHPVPFFPTIAGNYTFVTSTQLVNDLVFTNNQKTLELRVVDTTGNVSLRFEDQTQSSIAPLSWTGGNGGAGYYFIPPYYPCVIDTISAFIVSNASSANFYMEIYDDDAPFATPGTRLDSQQVFNPQPITPGGWFSIALPNPVTITSGGFYLSWNMDGDGIQLGTDQIAPFSNRTFEVLGSSWAVFRYRETQDLMIRANVHKVSGVGIDNPEAKTGTFGDFYPNPASDLVSVKFTMPDGVKKVTYSIYDMQGKEVAADRLAMQNTNQGIVTIATGNLKAGIYNCKFVIDGQLLNRRFVVNK